MKNQESNFILFHSQNVKDINTLVLEHFSKKRLAHGDPGINRLDRIAKQHDIDYSNAKNIRDKWKADLKMVHAIDALPGKKSTMEKLSRNIIAAKRKFKL